MPTNGGSYYGCFTENIPLWEACKRKVTEEMVAAGWTINGLYRFSLNTKTNESSISGEVEPGYVAFPLVLFPKANGVDPNDYNEILQLISESSFNPNKSHFLRLRWLRIRSSMSEFIIKFETALSAFIAVIGGASLIEDNPLDGWDDDFPF